MPIRECKTCQPHEFQDRTYGKNRRVYTARGGKRGAAKTEEKQYCTVCNAVHRVSAAALPKAAAATVADSKTSAKTKTPADKTTKKK